jgi:hypothetical protein
MNTIPPGSRPPDWFDPLLKALGLTEGASLKEVFDRNDAAASELAPNTRRLWTSILVLEGIAIVLPLLWLVITIMQWSPTWTACAVLISTIGIVGACWWLRWRGMQRTWTHARVVAEIARSGLVIRPLAAIITQEALTGAPALQAIASRIIPGDADSSSESLEQAKARYLKDRVENQLEYYRDEQEKAIDGRKRLSRLVTYALDGALFLAVAGAALLVSGRAEYLLRISHANYILALGGTLFPLVALLMQSRSFFLELNRKTGRYAQQIDYLESAKSRVEGADTTQELQAVIRGVERALLAEVAEWFYQAEFAEIFYREPHLALATRTAATLAVHRAGRWQRFVRFAENSAAFIVTVVVFRFIVTAIAIVATVAWIAFQDARNIRSHNEFRTSDGRLISDPKSKGTADSWEPQPERAKRGFVLIAHGLRDGPNKDADYVRWMGRLEHEIEQHCSEAKPDICLVDWNAPAADYAIAGSIVGQVTAIRPRAEAIGQIVGCKLAMAIKSHKLDPEKPMHFIGHSAGGFVIMSATRTLLELGIKPKDLRLTILDTPVPDTGKEGDLLQILTNLSSVQVDYYCTSVFAVGVPEDKFEPHFSRFNVGLEDGIDSFTGAHSFAHEWYIRSILSPKNIPDGFTRSAFAHSP